MKTAVLIAGPTASGKSSLALAIAKRFGGTIVNADSMQVYADLRVVTARPTVRDMADVPHELYGHVDAADAYSAGRYVEDVRALLAKRGRSGTVGDGPLIFVGGTGLYFKALLDGLSPIPSIPEAIRQHWRVAAAKQTNADLHGALTRLDPRMAARLPAGDTQRIVRALEVIDATGQSLADWQALDGDAPLAGWHTVRFVMTGERELLCRRSDLRFREMVQGGAIDEVRRLAARELPGELPLMRAVGVGQLLQYAGGEMDLDRAISLAQQDTRRYIKRQQTWLKKHMTQWNNVHILENYSNELQRVMNLVSTLDE